MTVFIALLRSVNVGGTGKLPMNDLKAMCEGAGFTKVKTYIASGNVVFETKHNEATVKRHLETRIQAYAGRRVPIFVRTVSEMSEIVKANPFTKTDPARTVAIFLDEIPAKDTLATVRGQTIEEISLGKRVIYVHYGAGIGNSKLKIPVAENGTARNINTVRKLTALAASFNESR